MRALGHAAERARRGALESSFRLLHQDLSIAILMLSVFERRLGLRLKAEDDGGRGFKRYDVRCCDTDEERSHRAMPHCAIDPLDSSSSKGNGLSRANG
jgi:hypothetical protein